MTDSEEVKESQPWWVSSVYKIGIPSAIACYLVYWVVSSVDAKLTLIQSDIKVTVVQVQEQSNSFKALLNLNQQICINTAVTQEAKNACWNPWK